MKKIAAAGLVIIILIVALFLGSPYYAVHNFVSVAKSADVDQIDAAVDFPRVRESVKSQLNAMLTARMQSDPAMRNNPFAGLGMMLAPAFVDRMVDGTVTADGIATMVKQGKMAQPGSAQPAPDSNTEISYGYSSLDRFRMKVSQRGKPADHGSTIPTTVTGDLLDATQEALGRDRAAGGRAAGMAITALEASSAVTAAERELLGGLL